MPGSQGGRCSENWARSESGDDHRLPSEHFEPVALPRMLGLITVSGPEELAGAGTLARSTFRLWAQ